jgi:aminoglycoside phosphotransferase (APT) family kinase protein
MPLSTDSILSLASRHHLKLQTDSLKIDESGLDFQVAIAKDYDGQSWLLRIPRRLDVLPAAAREKGILDLIRPHLPVQVPHWKIHTNEQERSVQEDLLLAGLASTAPQVERDCLNDDAMVEAERIAQEQQVGLWEEW